MAYDTVDGFVDMFVADEVSPEEWDLAELNRVLLPIIPLKTVKLENVKDLRKDETEAQRGSSKAL